MNEAIVKTENLTKFYGRSRGISHVDLAIERGEIFGFLGPNGAGKTTTIRILLDLIRPSSGRAMVFGLDCRKHSVEVRRRVGYLPGEFTLYDHLTGGDILRYFAALRGGVDAAFIKTLADRLDSDTTRPLGELSHGNKQKIGLIQALMNQPELLILDEPTTGLDPLMQQEFYGLLNEVRKEGKTVFLSSHVLPEVERVCDRVAIIREGRLVAVEDVTAIKDKAVREVEVTFESPPPPDAFAHLAVHDLVVDGCRLRCNVQGTIDPLIKTLAQYDVADMTSREPNLEEVFLAMYGDDEHAQ